MNAHQTCDTQLILPTKLHQAIEQRAKVHGHSINSEIVAILAASLITDIDRNLAYEFAAWEAASDEDWLNMEAMLGGEEQHR